MLHHITKLQDIIRFWFAPENHDFWFSKNEVFDRVIRNKFYATYEFFLNHDPFEICNKKENYLAMIILYDQFPRNMFRNDAGSFATDELALSLSKKAIEEGIDKAFTEEKRRFIYMPFMHSEKLEDQEKCVELFEDLDDKYSLDYAKQHLDIIKKWNRFPHRNKILSRNSSKAEQDFLKTPNSSF